MRVTNFIASFLFLTTFLMNIGVAQTTGLKVGDSIPEELRKVIHYNFSKSKPTIINFWATWCAPCIDELKLLDSVLKESDEINVLSVTYEDEKTINSFLDRNLDLRGTNLTIISSDTLFNRFFPHRILPHNIWLDPRGNIKYITGGENINRKNILAFTQDQSINATNKSDDIRFDPFAPFHLSDSEFEYRSILTKRIDGILSGKTIQAALESGERRTSRAFCYNSTLSSMLWLAINRGISPDNYYNTMRIETNDSLLFFAPSQAPKTFERSSYQSRDEWRMNHTYCYELSMPNPISDTLFYEYMLNDLARNFDIDIVVVEDSIKCSIITIEDEDRIRQPQGDSTFIDLNKTCLTANNVSILRLFEYLNEHVKEKLNDRPTDPPFVDQTGGLRVNINLEFENGIPKYQILKRLIQEKYGINIHYSIDKYRVTLVKDREK